MKHDKLTDEQIAEAGLLPEGIKDFTVQRALEKISSNGNPMFELTHEVHDNEGNVRTIRDWVMPSFAKKFKHLHDALGILNVYEKGETVPLDLEGKSGKLILKIGEPRQNKDGIDVRYNQVDDYVKREADQADKPKAVDAISDDEVPF